MAMGRCKRCGIRNSQVEDTYCKDCERLLRDALNLNHSSRITMHVASTYASGKSKLVAALLALFLGSFGVHRFYLGQLRGLWYLLFCWTALPLIISFIEGLVFLFISNERWDKKFN